MEALRLTLGQGVGRGGRARGQEDEWPKAAPRLKGSAKEAGGAVRQS